MKFRTWQIADVSSANITPEDGKLLNSDIGERSLPYKLGDLYDGEGTFFYVPVDKWNDGSHSFDPEDKDLMVQRFQEVGFSQEFINIFLELQRQGIPYVRIDRDVELVENAPIFEW